MSGGPDYLAQINSALGAPPPPPPRVPGPAPAPPLDFMGQIGSTLGAPQPTGQVIDNGAIAQGGFTLAPSPGPLPPPPVPTGPLGPVERAPIGPPSPAPSPEPARPFLQQVGGAGVANVPAKETELRGPHLQVAQQARNTAFEEALHNVNERTQDAVMHERDLAFEQERLAHAREDAANAAAAQRNEEMQQRQADFDQGVKALSQQSIDPNRFWSNTSTGGKIGAFIAIALGGFTSQQNGGRNLGLDQVNKMINDDVRAQEFAFQAQHAAVNAKQTAFSMAMQKYNNVDAARAMARAAALDTAQAQVAQQAALWKGTEAANRAEIAAASLQDEKMQQVAAGIAFMPARQVAVGASYVDPRTGLRYSEQEAKGLVKTIDEHDFEERKQGAGIAGQMLVEGQKAGATKDKSTDEGTRFIAEKLQGAGVPQARAAAEAALKDINKSPGGTADTLARGALGDHLSNKLLPTDANAREQSYNAFKNAAMKALMGNVTASEEARAEKQFGDAHDPESRKRAINSALDMLEGVEKGIKAGASPEVQAEYDKRRKNAEGAPAAPKGSKAGW